MTLPDRSISTATRAPVCALWQRVDFVLLDRVNFVADPRPNAGVA